MMRLPAVLFALVLFAVPCLTAPIPPVVVTGLIGLLLAAAGIAALWRWPVTAAACVFLTDYAAALWVAKAAVSVTGAVGFGLSLLLLLEAAELGRRMRHATVDARVHRSLILRGIGLGAATLAVAALVLALAGAFAASVPGNAAPVVAAAGALGVALAAAAVVTGAARAASRRGPDTPSSPFRTR